MSSDDKLPTGRLARIARMAMLGARTGVGLLGGEDRGERAAERVAATLSGMRGLAAKLGQMASYVDGAVPSSGRESFERALATLRDAAATSPPDAVRALVEAQLGAPIDEMFAEWDDRPFASASIGQVHRARLPDGRAVAVKVQHPGIETALESDLGNSAMLGALTGALFGASSEVRGAVEEAKRTLREELDYRLEAERQSQFIAIHRGDRRIHIPAVIAPYSTARVLTTELARGLTLEEACAASEAERRAWAETLWRFVFRSLLNAGRFNADPHPGNFFFHEGGAITAIDFGCVVDMPEERRTIARRVHRAAIDRDERAFADASREMMRTEGGELETFMLAYMRRFFAMLFESPYRVTRDYTASLVRDALGSVKVTLRNQTGRLLPVPEGMLFMNRLQFGFYSVLARLDVEVDYARVDRALLAEPAAPSSVSIIA